MQKNKATVKEVIDELMVEHGLEAEDTILWHPYRGETVERKLSDLDKKDLRKKVNFADCAVIYLKKTYTCGMM